MNDGKEELPYFALTGKIFGCCESLIREHQAQLFNYLKVSNLPLGLLKYKRLHGSEICDELWTEESVPL